MALSSALPDNEPQTQETTPGKNEGVKWVVVARTPGLAPAQIMADRLKTEGIPVRAWQESAGQSFGLTVGLLGTGYVMVPEDMADKALDILEDEDETDWDEIDWDEEE